MDKIAVVEKASSPEGWTFAVTVGGDGGTRHEVRLTKEYFDRFSAEDPSSFVVRCFEFLLRREPKESILGSFEIPVIARYFPEFEREISASR